MITVNKLLTEDVLLTILYLKHGHLPGSGCLPGILHVRMILIVFVSRVVYEGQALECVLDGCTTEEDVVHSFRVAAMNEVGRGPYSMPVTFTQRKACEFKVHACIDTGNVYLVFQYGSKSPLCVGGCTHDSMGVVFGHTLCILL